MANVKFRHTFRADQQYSKQYYENLCADFTLHFSAKLARERDYTITAMDYGKQDTRGAPSITVFDERHCAPYQRHFASMKEMRAFMEGWLVAAGHRHA